MSYGWVSLSLKRVEIKQLFLFLFIIYWNSKINLINALLAWKQIVDKDVEMFGAWNKELWTQTKFMRVWWFQYTGRAVV